MAQVTTDKAVGYIDLRAPTTQQQFEDRAIEAGNDIMVQAVLDLYRKFESLSAEVHGQANVVRDVASRHQIFG